MSWPRTFGTQPFLSRPSLILHLPSRHSSTRNSLKVPDLMNSVGQSIRELEPCEVGIYGPLGSFFYNWSICRVVYGERSYLVAVSGHQE